jgi:hypothetical protein
MSNDLVTFLQNRFNLKTHHIKDKIFNLKPGKEWRWDDSGKLIEINEQDILENFDKVSDNFYDYTIIFSDKNKLYKTLMHAIMSNGVYEIRFFVFIVGIGKVDRRKTKNNFVITKDYCNATIKDLNAIKLFEMYENTLKGLLEHHKKLYIEYVLPKL